MDTGISITGVLRITKKKLAVCVLFPVAAAFILFFGFVCDEVLGLGGSRISHSIYSVANYLYHVIFLPLTFVDSDSSAPEVFKMALLLTPVWWYSLACVLVLFVGRRGTGKG